MSLLFLPGALTSSYHKDTMDPRYTASAYLRIDFDTTGKASRPWATVVLSPPTTPQCQSMTAARHQSQSQPSPLSAAGPSSYSDTESEATVIRGPTPTLQQFQRHQAGQLASPLPLLPPSAPNNRFSAIISGFPSPSSTQRVYDWDISSFHTSANTEAPDDASISSLELASIAMDEDWEGISHLPTADRCGDEVKKCLRGLGVDDTATSPYPSRGTEFRDFATGTSGMLPNRVNAVAINQPQPYPSPYPSPPAQNHLPRYSHPQHQLSASTSRLNSIASPTPPTESLFQTALESGLLAPQMPWGAWFDWSVWDNPAGEEALRWRVRAARFEGRRRLGFRG